jgi:flagellar biosynthesis chaperone FliJ
VNTQVKRLKALQELAAMRKDLALGALAKAGAARDAVTRQIDALTDNQRAARAEVFATPEAGIQSAKYEMWARQEADRLAGLRRQREAEWAREREAAALAHGRAEALEQIGAQQRQEAKLIQSRKNP